VRDDSEAGPIGAMKDAANEAAKRGRNKVTNNDYQYFEYYKKKYFKYYYHAVRHGRQ
jgi:hypothetical protein